MHTPRFLPSAGLWGFLLAGASLDLKMKRKGVIFTCLNDGCSVRVMGVRLNSPLHLLSLVLTVREHVLVWRIHVQFLYLTVIVSVCACDCVGIWMCVCVCGVCMWVSGWVLDFTLFPLLSFKEMRFVPIWAGDLLHFKLYHNVN